MSSTTGSQRAHAADQQRTADRDALAFDVAVAAPARAREERVGRGAAGRAARRRKWVTGVFVRSPEQIGRSLSAVQAAGMRPVQLDDGSSDVSGSVAVGTMHLAKGLEFRAVVVAACDDEVVQFHCRPGSNASGMTRISRRSTAPSGTCSTSLAPAHATGYW